MFFESVECPVVAGSLEKEAAESATEQEQEQEPTARAGGVNDYGCYQL